MATPRRRSSRVKGNNTTPAQSNATPLTSKLSSLLERDESPPEGVQFSIDSLVSSPVAPPNTAMPQARFNNISSVMRTLQTASRLYPPLGEMHPSKVQSAIKQSASRQSLSMASLSKPSVAIIDQQTPSKSKGSFPNHMTSPSFDFSFERPESELSSEAQKIMDSVREEASKIKAQMLEERSKKDHKDGETDQLYGVGGRKIAKAKGKSGRYSDVEKFQLKKMDSIAGHASIWKNKIQANTSALKRSPSKAGLDEPDKPLSRSKSFKSFQVNAPSERLENACPGKCAKQNHYYDISAARPVSRDTNSTESAQNTPAKARPHSSLPSAVTTPTKASLARSASVKTFKTSIIPSLSRSDSKKTLGSPVAPKTEGSNKYLSSLSRFGNMKSILHRAQPKFSNDPTKLAAGTHLPLPSGKMDPEKELSSLPGTPLAGLQRSSTIKHVGFTPSTKSQQDLANKSPSPSKFPTPRVPSSDIIPSSDDALSYPVLANSPNITTRNKIPRASAPGDFTFRAEKTLNFSPSKVSSPSSTIRHVRPSGISTPLPTFDSLPAIPHGIKNKKRSRPESETEAEDENIDPMDVDEGGEDQPRAKKQRMNILNPKVAESQSPTKSRIPKRGGGAKEKGRMGLSLGRLNMLARPKERR